MSTAVEVNSNRDKLYLNNVDRLDYALITFFFLDNN